MIFNADFAAKRWQIYLVFVACCISHAIAGSVATKVISKLQAFCIWTNLIVIAVTIIALPNGTGKENLNSGKFVFGHVEDLSTWPTGWEFFMAWLSPIWTIGAFDSCVHMSEEASNAATAVPLGIVLSISMCGILGFLICAVLAACIQDFESIVTTPLGQPMAQIYYNALGSNWAGGMMIMLFFISWFMGLSIVIAASRQTWAFSRDGALPFSRLIRQVNVKLGVPLRALYFDILISIVLGLLVLIGPAAANALSSLCIASNGLAWLTPILCRTIWFNKDDFTPGPFYLGNTVSRINGAFASIYLIFAIFVLAIVPVG